MHLMALLQNIYMVKVQIVIVDYGTRCLRQEHATSFSLIKMEDYVHIMVRVMRVILIVLWNLPQMNQVFFIKNHIGAGEARTRILAVPPLKQASLFLKEAISTGEPFAFTHPGGSFLRPFRRAYPKKQARRRTPRSDLPLLGGAGGGTKGECCPFQRKHGVPRNFQSPRGA